MADNRLAKIPEFANELVFDSEFPNSYKISMIFSPVRKYEDVLKLGIRTGLTCGTIMDDVDVRWHSELTDQFENEIPE